MTTAASAGPVSRTRPLVLYDGTCGFCAFVTAWLARRAGLAGELQAWQAADLASLGLTERQASRQLWFIGGRAASGGCAGVAAWLRTGRAPWRQFGRLLQLPVAAQLGSVGYRVVAANRHRIPGPWEHTCQVTGISPAQDAAQGSARPNGQGGR
jgi:predicted DCC family thiol-disulfide oxidoreductase YuxK